MATTNDHVSGNAVASPKITLYTNHQCPYAHRAHIALKELNLPFEEVIIDLTTPRPQWYLDINPRGLVPAIKYSVPGVYDEEIVTESAIVVEFLANSFPGTLLPGLRDGPRAALERARISFFVDTWNTKISGFWFQTLLAPAGSVEKEAKAEEWFRGVEKELEPLLSDAAPYFHGSKELTFAEVHAAPFVVRWYALGEHEDLIPTSLIEKLDSLPNFSKWAKAIRGNERVTKVVDWEGSVDAMRAKVEEFRAKAAAKK